MKLADAARRVLSFVEGHRLDAADIEALRVYVAAWDESMALATLLRSAQFRPVGERRAGKVVKGSGT